MIAQGDAVDAGGQQFVVDFGRQSRAAGGVLGVGHHQIEASSARSPRMACVQMCRPGFPTMSPIRRMRMRVEVRDSRIDGYEPEVEVRDLSSVRISRFGSSLNP